MAGILKILLVSSLLFTAVLAESKRPDATDKVKSYFENVDKQALKDLKRLPDLDQSEHFIDEPELEQRAMKDLDTIRLLRKQRPVNKTAKVESTLLPFTATVTTDKAKYTFEDKVTCQFTITNNHPKDYYLLKRNTPFEDLRTSFMTIKQPDGKKIRYDGLIIRRGNPLQNEYILMKAGSSITAKVDLTLAYAMDKRGPYTIQFDTEVKYHESTGSKLENEVWPLTKGSTQPLSSRPVTIKIGPGGEPRKTLGQMYREAQSEIDTASSESFWIEDEPLDPVYSGGSYWERELLREVHRAAYTYAHAALDDIDDDPEHFETWFGTSNSSLDHVRYVFGTILYNMETTTFAYVLRGGQCEPSMYAYTYYDATVVFLCDQYFESSEILGTDTQLCTLIHEISHAVAYTDDITYGTDACLDLAANDPELAIINADNYCYYSESLNVFDYGFDSMFRLLNGHTFITRGNVYIRYSDLSASQIDDGYPRLIHDNFGSLPDSFNNGFDSAGVLANNKTYITKENLFVRYSDEGASLVDDGYPLPIIENWGTITSLTLEFYKGFDAMTKLRNGKGYVTKGPFYVRYSDQHALTIDEGYPQPIEGNWGLLPSNFNYGFDSMAVLGNDKTYVTKGKEYVRYSDRGAFFVDVGYPRPIKGNWGTINFSYKKPSSNN